MAGRKEEEETTVSAAGEEEEEKLMEDVAVLDFDMLCATVAMQTQGLLVGRGRKVDGGVGEEEEKEFGGVQRMWEGEVLDCCEDRRIAFQTVCCPCYRFGKNMERAGFGSCCLQGTIYVILLATALINYVAFGVTRQHCFLYMAVAFTISVGIYLGIFRTQIRKQFNIRGSNSGLDDCIQHIICPCCTLCQESRTLEINNVQDGIWRGRGDTICVGNHTEGSKFFELRQPSQIPSKSPALLIMEREPSSDIIHHSWNIDRNSEPLVPSN